MSQIKIDVDQLKATVDLVAVVERYVQLRRAGKEYAGLCPFHNESSPSFTVIPAKGFVHCFGCGAHHDVIGFLMAITGCDFHE
ncbi:CHC2 zinc finger domain-containing protein, partial [Xanthomonas hortorum]